MTALFVTSIAALIFAITLLIWLRARTRKPINLSAQLVNSARRSADANHKHRFARNANPAPDNPALWVGGI
ncbi:MAG: hypothetical protein LLG14_21635 [Nocardiaceae bacterium]|nr:hypothetical protein [Nocardiaceae bacterium]